MIVDFDDFHETNHELDLLETLKLANPLFRCTVFAVPGLGSDGFWGSLPRWIELAVHGWEHPHPRECQDWNRGQIEHTLDHPVVRKHFVNGWKSPGWQTSPDIYEVLLERGWWIADQHLADDKRPAGLRTYLHEDHDSWHGHIQDVCGNGLRERWYEILHKVILAREFRFASEVAC